MAVERCKRRIQRIVCGPKSICRLSLSVKNVMKIVQVIKPPCLPCLSDLPSLYRANYLTPHYLSRPNFQKEPSLLVIIRGHCL